MDGGRSVTVTRPKASVRSFNNSQDEIQLLCLSAPTDTDGGSVRRPTREYCKGLGFQSHRNELVCRARKRTTNEQGVYMPRRPSDSRCLPVATDTNPTTISARRHPESPLRAPVGITGACIHFPKMQEPPQNPKRLTDDRQQVAHWGPANIRRQCTLVSTKIHRPEIF